MSAPALVPTAPTTLVIVLGASAWPNSPGFQASQAFVNAAQGFRDYVLDPQGFGLPTANLLDLFDATSSASDQLEMLGSFLEQRAQTLKAANQAVRDVLVYFAGHGGFAGPSADFYLLHRRANASSLRASGMAIDALAEVLREKARQTRRYLFLDCCFAAAAFRSFQGGPDQTAITKTLDAFHVQARSSGFPRKGTVLLCSSDHKSPSLLLPDESCTMFSRALLDVLRNGDLHRSPQLSLRDIKELAEDRLSALPEKNAPRPGLHSPDQSEGDVADVPFFPNPRAEEERRRQAEEAEKERMRNIKEQTSPIPSPTFPPTIPPNPGTRGSPLGRAATPQQGPVPRLLKPRPPIASSQIVIPHQRSSTLPSPSIPKRPKRLRSPSVAVVLILFVLILLGAGSIGAYGVATGNWPWGSVPGRIWHTQNSGTAAWLDGVAWSGSQFVAVGEQGTIVTSPDGRTWTPRNSGTTQDINAVASSGSLIVAVEQNCTIATSPDGRTWTPHNSGTTLCFNAVTWSGSQFVAVGLSVILTSPNGSTWTPRKSGTNYILDGVAWSGSQFVAIGYDNEGVSSSNTILTSPDGRTWTPHNSGTTQDLRGVAWSGSQFVVIGDTGIILTSPDGSTWTLRNSDTTDNLLAVASSGSLIVAVGYTGTILTSP